MWTALQSFYHAVNYEWADPRAQHLPLVERPFSVLALMAGYVLFVTRLGPWLMRDRKPFELKTTLVVYNVLQILANLYLFMALTPFWLRTYSFQCEPVDYSYSPSALEMLRLVNYYFWLKIIDFFDTIFFVLRKKDNQITFLHVYHHNIMVFLSWCGIKYVPGGHVTLLGFVNALVHAIMYSYYLISVAYPSTIWWKKHVTQIQLIQHWTLGLHEAQLLVYNPCKYPILVPILLLPQAVIFIVLFMLFYRRIYSPQSAIKPKTNTS